jgi:streptogramin lyase
MRAVLIVSLVAVTGLSVVSAVRPGRARGQSAAPLQVVFPLPRDTAPDRLALAADGSVWTTSDLSWLTRLSPGGATKRFFSRWDVTMDVTRGPDGAVYAIQEDAVVRIDARGKMRRYRVRSSPSAITADADAVWVVGFGYPPRIERVRPDGEVHEFVDHPPRRWLTFEGVATAADGSVWFTQAFAHRDLIFRGGIGRMRPDGSFSNWRLPVADGVPVRIAAGSDGAMWFGEPRAIGRIAVNGSITRFALPNGLRPNDIASGRDGALWFTSDICLGRMTRSGQVTTWPIPGAVQLRGIAPAPDGTVWLADGAGDAIRHVNPAAAAPAQCGPPELRRRHGATIARLAYTLNGVFTDLSIRIERHGRTLLSEDVPAAWAGFPAQADRNSLSVRDLDGDGEPEVMLLLNSGGAHCCAWSRVYGYVRGRDTFVPVVRRWGEDSAQPRIRDVDRDGRPEFVSSDDRFFETAFGNMGPMPIQIWSFRHVRFRDVTRRFPRLLRRDAASIWRLYRRYPEAARLVFPAWVADECRLGRGHIAYHVLEQERRRGALKRSPGVYGPRDPHAYIRGVKRLLRRTGYKCRRAAVPLRSSGHFRSSASRFAPSARGALLPILARPLPVWRRRLRSAGWLG